MERNSVDCVVTSPPYWQQRRYSSDDELGREDSPELYIENLVRLFDDIKPVLKSSGTIWINVGDKYASKKISLSDGTIIKQKDLIQLPMWLGWELRKTGWYLRANIIWHKTDAMPEGKRDRPYVDYETILMLSKEPKYYYNREKIREPFNGNANGSPKPYAGNKQAQILGQNKNGTLGLYNGLRDVQSRNKRSVWSHPTARYLGNHNAVMPVPLADICIKGGCPDGGLVFDPFGGSGTTAIAALQNDCDYVLVELNPEYVQESKERIAEWKLNHRQMKLPL